MEFEELLQDVELNSTNVTFQDGTDLKLEDLRYFKTHPYISWAFLILMIVSTVVGNIGNILVCHSSLSCFFLVFSSKAIKGECSS